MLVDELYYGRHRVQRVYKNGKIIWYAGDMLPLGISAELLSASDIDGGLAAFPIVELFDGTEVQIASEYVMDGGLTVASAVLGGSDGASYARYWGNQHGTSLTAVMASNIGEEFLEYIQKADICGLLARLGNMTAPAYARVYGSATGTSAQMRLGSMRNNHHSGVLGSATGVSARAALGSLDREHPAEVSGQATGISARAVLGSSNREHSVYASDRATSVAARAAIGSGRRDHHMEVKGRATGIAARAASGKADIKDKVSYRSRATGVAAASISLYETAVIRPFISDASKLATPAVVGLYRDAKERVRFITKGTGLAASSVLFSGTMKGNTPVTSKNRISTLPSTSASSSGRTNLSIAANGGLTEGIRVVSASVVDRISCNLKTEAHLSDFQLPVVEDGNLHIRQVYDVARVGYKLMLSELDIKELPDKIVSKPTFATVGIDPVLDANLSDWKLSLAFGDHLYIRQTERGIRNGTNLYVSEWDYPIKANGNLYIRQTDSDIALL